jgi:hypothetical protein
MITGILAGGLALARAVISACRTRSTGRIE